VCVGGGKLQDNSVRAFTPAADKESPGNAWNSNLSYSCNLSITPSFLAMPLKLYTGYTLIHYAVKCFFLFLQIIKNTQEALLTAAKTVLYGSIERVCRHNHKNILTPTPSSIR
jgi:hypothetical protein